MAERCIPYTFTLPPDIQRLLSAIPKGQKSDFLAKALRATEEYRTLQDARIDEI